MSEETFEVELTAMAHGGSALGRYEKKTIFVPYTIPGEIVEVQITEDKGRVAFGRGVRLIDASADRIYPRCPHFGPGRCGRCQWQHIDYAAQLLLKQDILADQLARVGGFEDADVKAVIPSAVVWGYNYHMALVVTPDGQPGLPGADSPAFIIEECHILHPDLLDLFYRLDLEFSGVRRIDLHLGTDGNDMMALYAENEEDAPELEANFPTSVNLILPTNEPVNMIGDTHVRYEIGGRSFRVTAGSAFRSNIAQIKPLVEIVMDLLPKDVPLLDLYAGVGLFSAFAAPFADFITLVESFPPAATDADENLADFDNVDVIEGTVEDVLTELEEKYAAAIIDPPSEGLSLEVIDALGASGIPKLIYISSDPATLARDAKRLVNHGYTLGAVQPIDLNPQTYYIDAVAVLERQSP